MSTCWDGSASCGELNQPPPTQPSPDSHEERFRRVRQAMQERRMKHRVDAASKFIRRLVGDPTTAVVSVQRAHDVLNWISTMERLPQCKRSRVT